MEKLLIKIYHFWIKFVNRKKWKDYNDVYATNYSASPKNIKKYIFFNKIDFDLACACLEIKKKSKYVNFRIKKSYSCLSKYLFLNLTDSLEGNYFLTKQVKKMIKIYGIKNIIYRFHPRCINKSIISEIEQCNVYSINYKNQLINKKIIEMQNCEFIVSAVSSSLTSLKNYSGSVFVSKKASNFLNDKNFKYFIEVLKKNLSTSVIIS